MEQHNLNEEEVLVCGWGGNVHSICASHNSAEATRDAGTARSVRCCTIFLRSVPMAHESSAGRRSVAKADFPCVSLALTCQRLV